MAARGGGVEEKLAGEGEWGFIGSIYYLAEQLTLGCASFFFFQYNSIW